MTRSFASMTPAQGAFNLRAILALILTSIMLAAGWLLPTSAQAQGMTASPPNCIGSCTPLPQFSVGTFAQGWTGAANYANFGSGGVGKAESLSQDFMKIEVNLKAAGNPNGLCGDGCIGNVVEVTINAGALAQGKAMHTLESAPAGAGGMASTNSASSVGLGAVAGAVWGLQVKNPPLPVATP